MLRIVGAGHRHELRDALHNALSTVLFNGDCSPGDYLVAKWFRLFRKWAKPADSWFHISRGASGTWYITASLFGREEYTYRFGCQIREKTPKKTIPATTADECVGNERTNSELFFNKGNNKVRPYGCAGGGLRPPSTPHRRKRRSHLRLAFWIARHQLADLHEQYPRVAFSISHAFNFLERALLPTRSTELAIRAYEHGLRNAHALASDHYTTGWQPASVVADAEKWLREYDQAHPEPTYVPQKARKASEVTEVGGPRGWYVWLAIHMPGSLYGHGGKFETNVWDDLPSFVRDMVEEKRSPDFSLPPPDEQDSPTPTPCVPLSIEIEPEGWQTWAVEHRLGSYATWHWPSLPKSVRELVHRRMMVAV